MRRRRCLIWGLAAIPLVMTVAPARALSWGRKQTVVLEGQTRTFEATAWSPSTLRLRLDPEGMAEPSVILDPAAQPSAKFKKDREKGSVRLATVRYRATFSGPDYCLKIQDTEGRILLEEPEKGGLSPRAVALCHSPEDTFYGLHVHPNELELWRRGEPAALWMDHRRPVAPWVLSPSGYAVFVHTAWPTSWTLPANSEVLKVNLEKGPLDLFIVVEPSLAGQILALADLTGKPQLPPRWAFGYIQSRWGYSGSAEIQSVAATLRAKRIPCDAMHFDYEWFTNDFEWNKQSFPDPPKNIGALLDKGIQPILIRKPRFINRESIPDGFTSGLTVLTSKGGTTNHIDFTIPRVRWWWWEQHRHIVDLGVRGWLDDEGEWIRPEWQLDAGWARKYHNLYYYYWLLSQDDGHRRDTPNDRYLIIARSSYPGLQRFRTVLWSGDNRVGFHDLGKVEPAYLLGTCFLVQPFDGYDVGGFHGDKCSPELYTRYMQAAMTTPFFWAHGTKNRKREPWAFGPEAEGHCKAAIELRYRLLPYIYTYVREACDTGLSPMRPMIVAFQDDPRFLNLTSQWMLGRELLCAPVLEQGATRRRVLLPEGRWYDFWTGKKHAGGGEIELSVTTDSIPLFVRAGSILPLGPVMQYSTEKPVDPLEIRVYPGADASFSLYEDDGLTVAAERGEFSRILFDWDDRKGRLTIGKTRGRFDGELRRRTIRIVVVAEGRGAGAAESPDAREVFYRGHRIRFSPDQGTASRSKSLNDE